MRHRQNAISCVPDRLGIPVAHPGVCGRQGFATHPHRLGVLPKREAREIADRLAAVARVKFRELAKGMAGKESNGIDDDEQQAMLLVQLTMMMKSTLFDIRNPPSEPATEEARGPCVHEGCSRLRAATVCQAAGLPHEPLIADNAEALAMIRYQKFEKELREGKAPSLSSLVHCRLHL